MVHMWNRNFAERKYKQVQLWISMGDIVNDVMVVLPDRKYKQIIQYEKEI